MSIYQNVDKSAVDIGGLYCKKINEFFLMSGIFLNFSASTRESLC